MPKHPTPGKRNAARLAPAATVRTSHHILMVAAENGALPGGKVGGVGDVVRDAPRALADAGCRVTVLTPSYGFLLAHSSGNAVDLPAYHGSVPSVVDCHPEPAAAHPQVRHCVLAHPLLHSPTIYVQDPPERPFATDATKYAHFCRLVAEALRAEAFGTVDVLHLHDWQTGFLPILREFHPECGFLRAFRTVYSVHNLAYQGVRPLTGDPSSLQRWFPELKGIQWKRRAAADHPDAVIRDPRWPECVNPMAVGIRLADAVHLVSPTYAKEVTEPQGAEGLETDLRGADAAGRLHGILNGCEYPKGRQVPRVAPPTLLATLRDLLPALFKHSEDHHQSQLPHLTLLTRLGDPAVTELAGKTLVTCVTRAATQKIELMREIAGNGVSALESILRDELGGKGLLIMLSSGEREIEEFLTGLAVRHRNFLYVKGFSPRLAEMLYASGDLFLMPSSFEPCGIAQMLAMRDGQPVVAHATGGLKDTIHDGRDGFLFDGTTRREKADGFVAAFRRAIGLKHGDPAAWKKIVAGARAARFQWADSAGQYLEKLY